MKTFKEYMDGRHAGKFSEKSGISQAALSLIKNGLRYPTLEQATRIEIATSGQVSMKTWYAEKVGRKWELK